MWAQLALFVEHVTTHLVGRIVLLMTTSGLIYELTHFLCTIALSGRDFGAPVDL